ncbi:AraC-type DNA-binding protein [Bradyrhizobium lablabi]|uniref:AraC-type DNA-binding protein n=1 Tax=Bradyrhizobium lablabi TaxID=722472 RepID=A0A1M7EYV8_9BRAD|nr:AraC family transcriptional regulator [Bradyrhizobium lablabi]SHL96668.1 AraC-type DNA-binding protein [Bradyrhizobium lablabi]
MQQNSSIIRLSTEDFPERDRVAIFREQFGRSQFGLDIAALPQVPFRLTSTMRSLPGAVITSNVGSGVRVWRTREFLADGRDDLIMIMNLQGPSVVAQRGEEIVLDERSATLGTIGEFGGILRPQTNHRSLIVNLPRAAIGPLMPNADDAVLRPIAPDCTALRLLIRYAGALLDIDAPLQPELQRCIVDHIYDLVAAAVGGTRDAIEVARGRGIPAARLSAIKSDILGNLLSRNLSIETICARHGITPRYLRMLFAGEQTTFSDFVTGRRLALVLRKLRNPDRAGHTISAVAYECGFGDLSYFNRVFRRQFGMTPSDVRAQGVATRR